jgi:L-threonylcarbamoyladenylate synthase
MANKEQYFNIVKTLVGGGIAVIPTDTIYGIVALAKDQGAIEKIYQIKGRDSNKPFIILISNATQLADFGVTLDKEQSCATQKYWPGPYTLVFKTSKKLKYLSRGSRTLAFRIPKNNFMQNLIADIGPIVAPSANRQGMPPAKTILEAKGYFGTKVDAYQDGGELTNPPSTIIDLSNKTPKIIR